MATVFQAAPASRIDPRSRRPLWLGGVLVVAVVFSYANSLRAPFLFDDSGAVVNNPTIRRLISLDALNPPADGSTTTGRPLVNFSFAINYAISGENAWSYHALNIAIHALAALTLFGIVRRTVGRVIPHAPFQGQRLSERRVDDNAPDRLAFLIALLWALHPLQTETVVCIAQRTESLCGLFYFATLYCFIRATSPLEAGARCSPRAWFPLSVIVCLLGMATKEVMVTAPVLVLLYDRTFIAGTFSGAVRQRRGYYLSLVSTWLLLAGLVLRGGAARGASAGFGLGVSWWNYLLTQCEALVLYLKLALWPHPLVLDYGTAVVHSAADVWWSGILVLALLGGTAWALVRKPVAGFVAASWFLILAPSSSVIPLVTQTMAEHRMYLPMAALLAALVMGLYQCCGFRSWWFLAVAGVGLGVVVRARNHDYRDALTIWNDTAAKRPTSARAHHNLALALQQQGKAAEVDAHFARAIELRPDYVIARYNWAIALLDRGRTQEAVAQFEAALRAAPKQRGELVPSLADAHYQLARLAESAGDRATAESHYAETLQLSPNHLAAHAKLGLLLARTDRLALAADHFLAILRVAPNDVDAHANLGNVRLLQGQPREAIAHYEEVLRLRPGDPRARENLQLARESIR